MGNKLKKAIESYENICNELAEEFCRKQDMIFDGWAGNQIGGIAYCNDFFFNMNDIILDLKSNQPKGNIIDWYYSNTEEHTINYYSYTRGLRVEPKK